MNEFSRCKVTGVRWLKNPVEDLKIKLKLKPQDGTLSLPKFEDYANQSNGENLHKLDTNTEECTFNWQEKVFSQWELQRYSDEHNCISETELNYNNMINNQDYVPSKIFTYIHEDYHLPLPVELRKNNDKEVIVPSLSSCFERLNLNNRMSQILVQVRDMMMVVETSTSSMGPLFRSMEHIGQEEEQWEAMHIVFDNSEYNEDSQLLLKQEANILSLYHNKTHGYLIVSPDVNSLELNPYTVETGTGVSWGYQYSVELEFEEMGSGEELASLLRKLLKKSEQQQKTLLSFETPPLGKKHYFISLELLKATDFEMDNLYVEFNVKTPEDIQCSDTLHGRTHVSKSISTDEKEHWHFGHVIELSLETTTGSDPLPLQIFFEVISTDWWGRHRTEGYCYLALALHPGHYTKQLSCSRPEEMDSVEAESRRFFVGGCHLIKDLEVLAKPELLDGNITFVTTGLLELRWNIISQTALPGTLPRSEMYGTSSASAVLLGAEAVLRQYRRARARLAAATEGLTRGEPSG